MTQKRSEPLYPLKFDPVFCYRIWGGEKLRSVLKKDYEENSIGESWELSAVSGFETRVASGPLKGMDLSELIKEYGARLVGRSVFDSFGTEFPLLIKFIDAAQPLSIQVHPNDELARQRHNSFGKNEMWYVMEADEGSELILGFSRELKPEEYQQLLEEDRIMEVMNTIPVRRGDTFYIPTGRVHAIGKGVMLAEIQQTSDITYRIFDYNRVDAKTGHTRELHTELALDAIDFKTRKQYRSSYERVENHSNKMVHSPYFKTDFLPLNGAVEKDITVLDSFVLYLCVEGSAELLFEEMVYPLQRGETLLVPASCREYELRAEGAGLLEVSL